LCEQPQQLPREVSGGIVPVGLGHAVLVSRIVTAARERVTPIHFALRNQMCMVQLQANATDVPQIAVHRRERRQRLRDSIEEAAIARRVDESRHEVWSLVCCTRLPDGVFASKRIRGATAACAGYGRHLRQMPMSAERRVGRQCNRRGNICALIRHVHRNA
jgi:hypothetical protein